MRHLNRKNDELREVRIETDISKHAEGSCLISFGDTKVICTATIEETVPAFLRNKHQGWVTAEYSMLPRATGNRVKRESHNGKLNGRTQEIQRLIARSLRSVVDLKLLGERQIIVDCDVIQADGGTRTASITGGFVALSLACQYLKRNRLIKSNPIFDNVAAISCGIVKGEILIDLDYIEDSNAEVDANFILTGSGKIIEVQATAEHKSFSEDQLISMLGLAKRKISDLVKLQTNILEEE